MSEKILLMTDRHISEVNIPLQEDLIEQVIQICKERGISTIYDLGDHFQSRKSQSLPVLLATQRIFNRFIEENIKLLIISANHDKADQESESSFLTIFNNPPFINVIETYHIKENGDYIDFFLPYFKERGSYPDRLKELVKKQKNYKGKRFRLFTHIGINGVLKNDGSSEDSGLSKNDFKAFERVAVGHYHNYSDDGHIYYIGSIASANFGEDSDKGVVILNEDGSEERIKLNFPEFNKIEFNINEIDGVLIENLQQLKESGNKDIYRLIITGDGSKIKSSSHIQELKSLGFDVKTEEDVVVSGKLDAEQERVVLYEKINILPVFEEFCREYGIEDSDYAVEKLKQI